MPRILLLVALGATDVVSLTNTETLETWRYDAGGRLVEHTEDARADGVLERREQWTYEGDHLVGYRLETLFRGGEAFTYVHAWSYAAGDLRAYTFDSSNGDHEALTYDAAGNLLSHTRRSGTGWPGETRWTWGPDCACEADHLPPEPPFTADPPR